MLIGINVASKAAIAAGNVRASYSPHRVGSMATYQNLATSAANGDAVACTTSKSTPICCRDHAIGIECGIQAAVAEVVRAKVICHRVTAQQDLAIGLTGDAVAVSVGTTTLLSPCRRKSNVVSRRPPLL